MNKFNIGDKALLNIPKDEDGYREVGIVLHHWFDDDFKHYEYEIAFYRDDFPVGKPKCFPNILRYAECHLEIIS